MQPDATTGVAQPAEPAGPAGGGSSGWSLTQNPLVFLVLMLGIFYFLLLRPQQKRQRAVDDLLKALRKGDKVRTSGGIRGEIVDLTDADVTLLIADKVKINVLRSHIVSRTGTEIAKEPAKDSTKEKA